MLQKIRIRYKCITVTCFFMLVQLCTTAQSDTTRSYSSVKCITKEICTCYAADSLPYLKTWLTNDLIDSSVYVFRTGAEQQFIEPREYEDMPTYKDGMKSFLKYVNENFRPSYYEEVKARASIWLILRNNQIVDVRIVNRIGYNCNHYNYDAELKRVIMQTSKNWRTSQYKPSQIIMINFYFDIP